MKVVIEAPFKVSESQEETIREKASGLSEFRIGVTQVDVYFKLEDGTEEDHVQSHIEVRKPGNTIFASGEDQDFMKAFHDAFQKARRQVIKQNKILKKH